MKNCSVFIVFLFIITNSFSQKTPVLKVEGKQLGLSNLDIKVKIVGNIATTTYDMLFYNPTNSILEGELEFPLGENHNVSRFALSVNGKLREAVVVEKETGRIAFEQVVRRRVDPALLEKGTGNNYKARIYPIPAKGYKRVLLAYEQELIYSDNSHFYNLPLNFTNELEKFKLEISVINQKHKPIFEDNDISELIFRNWGNNFISRIEKENFIANKDIMIKIPIEIETQKIYSSDEYFYAYKLLNPQKRLRQIPKEITIFWDSSLSMKNRDLDKELELLDQYFLYNENVIVNFIQFSNIILSERKYSVKNGEWNQIKSEIENVIYDGGTSYKAILQSNIISDAKFIFSDGMATLSSPDYQSYLPVFLINSLNKSNHSALKEIAESTNGAYLNLKTNSISDAISKIKFENYKFLGYKSSNKDIEVFPKLPMTVKNDFSIAGKGLINGETLTINFGFGNQITHTETFKIPNSKSEKIGLARIWAQKKLKHLEKNKKENESKITSLGKKYSLVTDYTSLIVLENVADYVAYEITPPKELLSEYKRLLSRKKGNEKRFSSNQMRITEIDRIEVIEDVEEVEEMIMEPPMLFKSDIDGVDDNGFDEIVIVEEIDEIELEIEEELAEDVPFAIIEEVPIFPGCSGTKEELTFCFSDSISAFIKRNFKKDIINNLNLSSGVQRIYSIFKINKEGNIENIRVRSEHRALQEETKRVLELLPQMTPGKQRGRPVSVTYSLPIAFLVDGSSNISDRQRIVFKTSSEIRRSRNNNNQSTPSRLSTFKEGLKVSKRKINTNYIKELKKEKTKEKAYQLYLIQRENYRETLAYFIDVSNFFKETYNDDIYSSRIASNIPEIDIDNYELLKVYAFQLEANNDFDLALFIHKRVLELRPEDAQSYRDLANAYVSVGLCQEALDLFNNILNGEIYKNKKRRFFQGISDISKNEIKHLIFTYIDDLDISKIDKELLDETISYDLRITIDWNHNDTDIDLHVIDPNLEECSYKHKNTQIGGNMSQDLTQGFGPEEFTLKNAIKGKYFVKINYYGDRYQKVENPTFMKINIFKKYGTSKETKETKIIRLSKNDRKEIVAEIVI